MKMQDKSVEDLKSFYNEEIEKGNVPIVIEVDDENFLVFSIENKDYEDYISVLKDTKQELYQLNVQQLVKADIIEVEFKNSVESLNLSLEISEVLQDQAYENWINESEELFNAMMNNGEDGLTLIFDRLELDELQQKSYQVHDKFHNESDYNFVDTWSTFSSQSHLLNQNEGVALNENDKNFILTGAEIERTLIDDFYDFSSGNLSFANYMLPVESEQLKMNQKYVVDPEISREPVLLSSYLEDKNVRVPGATFEDYVNSALKNIPEADGMVIHTLSYENFEEYFSEEVIDGFDKTYERIDRFSIDMDKPFIVIELSDSINPEANVVNIDEIETPEDMLGVVNDTLRNEKKKYRVESFNRKDVMKERNDRLEKEAQNIYRLDDELEL